jgi:hypothetical protein
MYVTVNDDQIEGKEISMCAGTRSSRAPYYISHDVLICDLGVIAIRVLKRAGCHRCLRCYFTS